eukprot:gene31332-6479_t
MTAVASICLIIKESAIAIDEQTAYNMYDFCPKARQSPRQKLTEAIGASTDLVTSSIEDMERALSCLRSRQGLVAGVAAAMKIGDYRGHQVMAQALVARAVANYCKAKKLVCLLPEIEFEMPLIRPTAKAASAISIKDVEIQKPLSSMREALCLLKEIQAAY